MRIEKGMSVLSTKECTTKPLCGKVMCVGVGGGTNVYNEQTGRWVKYVPIYVL